MFDRELQQIKDGVVRMGSDVEEAIDRSVAALQAHDAAAARAVVAADREINAAQLALSDLIATTIATQAPVARDLRMLIALGRAAYELERIGDHAAGVAKHTLHIGADDLVGGATIAKMGRLVRTLLHGSLRALSDLDEKGAREVAAGDDEVDKLYHAYFERVLSRMRADPSLVTVGTQLLFAAKDLERIGDRVTNIAEEVIFLATGEIVDLNP